MSIMRIVREVSAKTRRLRPYSLERKTIKIYRHIKRLPRRDDGRIYEESHALLEGGMGEADARSPQSELMLECGGVAAVASVSEEGAAYVRELHSDLMRPARLQLDAQQREALLGLEGLILQNSFFCACGGHGHDADVVGALVLLEIVAQLALRGLGRIAYGAKIYLLEITVPDTLAQSRRRLARLGKHHDAACGSVQSVY